MRRTPQFASIAFGSRGTPSRTVWKICALSPGARHRAANGGARTRASKRPAGHRARPPAPTRQRSSRRTPAEVLVLGPPEISPQTTQATPRPSSPSADPAPRPELGRPSSGWIVSQTASPVDYSPLLVAELRSLASSKPGAPSALVLGLPRHADRYAPCGHRGRGVLARRRCRDRLHSRWTPGPALPLAARARRPERVLSGGRGEHECKGSAAHVSPSPSLTRRARCRYSHVRTGGDRGGAREARCRVPLAVYRGSIPHQMNAGQSPRSAATGSREAARLAG